MRFFVKIECFKVFESLFNLFNTLLNIMTIHS